MRNVEFKQSQGPGFKRKLVAALLVLAGAALSWGYQHYAPRIYESSMTLLLHDRQQTQQLLAQAVNSLEKQEDRQRISATLEPGDLLRVSCRETLGYGEGSSCTNDLEQILAKMREKSSAQERQQTDLALAEKLGREKTVRDQLSSLENRFAPDEAQAKLLQGLRETAAGKGSLPAGWAGMLSGDGRLRAAAETLEHNLQAALEIRRQMVRDAALHDSLLSWIKEPNNQTVTTKVKRVIFYEDTPELIRLKEEKAEVEASRMRLLRRATTRHPQVVKMSGQIDELQERINALTRLPKAVEDVQVTTNPEMVKWQKELADIQSALKGNGAKLALLNKEISADAARLNTLLEDKRREDTASEQARLERELKAITARQAAEASAPFELYCKDSAAVLVWRPDIIETMSYGTLLGLAAAVLVLITRRKINFVVTEEEEKPEYPMLGCIPSFTEPAPENVKESA